MKVPDIAVTGDAVISVIDNADSKTGTANGGTFGNVALSAGTLTVPAGDPGGRGGAGGLRR